MRKNHEPVLVKKLKRRLNRWYLKRILRPQFDQLGNHTAVLNPRSVIITGENICAGDYLHIISNQAQAVKLTCWKSKQHRGEISIGNYCLLSPGVNIASAEKIRIGDNCMIAAEAYISDCDWHGIYNRLRPFRCSAPVVLENNVWIGLRAIICKGVSIGENSIVGAGAVVTENVPANVVVAGNPAKIVKKLEPKRRMLKRDFLFQEHSDYWQNQQALEDAFCARNSFRKWLRVCFAPGRED